MNDLSLLFGYGVMYGLVFIVAVFPVVLTLIFIHRKHLQPQSRTIKITRNVLMLGAVLIIVLLAVAVIGNQLTR